ncbi:hypothetical protein LINPERHAP2_LOCUS21602 [Linum perenne]
MKIQRWKNPKGRIMDLSLVANISLSHLSFSKLWGQPLISTCLVLWSKLCHLTSQHCPISTLCQDDCSTSSSVCLRQ